MSRKAALSALAALAGAWIGLIAGPALAAETSPFADWTAIFVAGDFHAHSGAPSEVFDNARHDLAKAFVAAGFSERNVREFSVRPELYPDVAPFPSQLETIQTVLGRATQEAKGGCLVYLSSHGNPSGALVGGRIMSPPLLARMLDEACGERPTVAVVSTCYSGVFVPALAQSNRMVMTAARPDRSSFGCGESDKYPYFDACVLETLPGAGDFMALARQAAACVARREAEEKLTPPSEPQTTVGGDLRPLLPLMPLKRAR